MGKGLRTRAIGAALISAIALLGVLDASNPRQGRAAAGAVVSSIKSGQSLSGQIRWGAEISGAASPSSVSRVVFAIDGVERWSEKSAPYEFHGDGGALDTRRLLAGPHTFTVRAVFADGSVATDSVIANAVEGVTFLHGNFEQAGRYEPFDGLEYRGVFEEGVPVSHQLNWVTSPVRRGGQALRFTVHPGDRYGRSSGERALLRYTDQISFEGADEYFAWSMLFPEDFAPPKWGLIFELHGDARFTLAPIRFNARKDSLLLDMTTGSCRDGASCSYERRHRVLSTLSKGRWNDFVVHIRFAKGRRGIVEVCHHVAGEREWRMVRQLRKIPTLPYIPGQADPTIYFLWGLYTGEGTSTRTVYGDNFTFATRPEAIAATFRRLPPDCRFTTTR